MKLKQSLHLMALAGAPLRTQDFGICKEAGASAPCSCAFHLPLQFRPQAHSAHGRTPAQAAGLIDHAWNIEEMLSVSNNLMYHCRYVWNMVIGLLNLLMD